MAGLPRADLRKKWKAVIDTEWAQQCDNWLTTHPGEAMPGCRLTFMNNFMKEKFKEETDEVKKEVEDFLNKSSEEPSKDLDEAFVE